MFSFRITKAFIWCFLLFLFSNIAGYSQTATSTSSFRISHTSTSRYFVAGKYIHTRDNQTIIAGKWGATEDEADLLVMKLNERGEVVWSKKAVVGIRLDEYELTEMSDGSIVLVANSIYNAEPTNSDMLLIKFACKGDIVWSKKVSMDASVKKRFLTRFSIKEGKNNDVIISFYSGIIDAMYTVISRVNSAGSLVWSKTFYGTHGETTLPSVPFLAGNQIVVFGFKSIYMNSFNYNKSFFAMKLNYDNGAVEATKGYNYSEFITNHGVLVTHPKIHFSAEALTDGNFVLYGEFSNTDRQKAYYYKLIINKDLSINRSTAFSTPLELGMNRAKMRVFPNGQTNIISAVYDRKRLYWYASDATGKKIREKKIEYPGAYLHLQYMAAPNGTNRATYMVSSMTESKSSIEMVQAEDGDPGNINCLGTDTSFIEELAWQASDGTMQWKDVKDNEATLTTLQFSTSDVSVKSEYICEPVKTQVTGNDQIKITGNDTVCATGAPFNYVGSTRSGMAPVQWELDSAQNGSLSRLNDSTVSISFVAPVGRSIKVKLYAYSGVCSVLRDSVSITVFPSNNKLSGNYNVCDLPLQLKPGSWFKNYLWQDGSTDSVYLVSKPGKYIVRLETYCGGSFNDTVEIAASGTGLKANYSICKNDSVTINATPGFSKYEWAPMYNLVSMSASSIKIYPEKDTSYTLKVLTAAGCELIDTFFIKVNISRPVNLGKDTLVCQNESVSLDAGSNFSSYKWNTGALTQKLVVNIPGTYYVTVRDNKNCVAGDTIIITGRQCQNALYIPNAFTPNGDGKNDVFKPRVTGRLLEYELLVYNRLGEVVFKTNQVNTGWTGSYKGMPQQIDTYVWMCKYRFENEESKMEKGTLLLIL